LLQNDGLRFRPTISPFNFFSLKKTILMKKKLLFFLKSLQHVCPSCQTRWTRAKEIFQFKKKKNFQGTILEGGSYIENLKIERQPSKKYPTFIPIYFQLMISTRLD
jgi:hypothetical protein